MESLTAGEVDERKSRCAPEGGRVARAYRGVGWGWGDGGRTSSDDVLRVRRLGEGHRLRGSRGGEVRSFLRPVRPLGAAAVSVV